MTKKAQTTTMDKLRTAILGTEGSGSLYRFLRSHHDEIVEMLDQVRRPDWKAITAALNDENLLDAAGKPPTPERVRQTWVKVRKDVEAARSKRPNKSQPAQIPPPVRLADPQPPALPAPADVPPASPRKRLELKPVTIKKQP